MNLHEEMVKEQARQHLNDTLYTIKTDAEKWDRMITEERIKELVAEVATEMVGDEHN